LPDGGMMVLHHRLDGVVEISLQMPAVGARRALARAIRTGAGPVSGDERYARVLPQPMAQDLGLAIRQEIHHLIALQIDEDAAVLVAAPPHLVIHPEHAGRRAGFWRQVLPTGHAEQRVGADGDGQP
jgi:hypothetical protein